MRNVFLSGLGTMGRRHLKGLVRAGFHVVGFDPDPASYNKALTELSEAGLSGDHFSWVDNYPTATFDVAIFSETASWRYQNIVRFLEVSKASRYLLEKPLSANPDEVEQYSGLFAAAGVAADAIYVNFPRRTWVATKILRELITGSVDVQITINGGAIGFGCNGIHYLDFVLHLAQTDVAEILFCELDEQRVASGRGSQYLDYGGRFLLRTGNISLFCAANAESSAPVLLTVRGDHFIVLLDETNLSWKVLKRSPDSKLPNYRCGADYSVMEQGALLVENLDVVTERWIERTVELPTLAEALPAHRLLERILKAGGAKPPFSYT
jgi:predicted dehydrogenase